MTRRSHRVATTAAMCWLLSVGSGAAAQTVGSLDVGATVIEYDGFLPSGAAVLAPALNYNSSKVTAGAQATWVLFESGNQILQGTAAAAWLSPALNGWRAEFSGTVGVSKYANAPVYAHALGGMRVHFQGERTGGWASGTTGGSWGLVSETPVELSVGGWHVSDPIALVGTFTSTWIAGAQYLDIVGAARWTSDRIQIDAQAGVRPWIDFGGVVEEPNRVLYGRLSALLPLGYRVGLTLSGGAYPSDPVRGVLGAKYVAGGLKLNLWGPRVTAAPVISRARVRADNEMAESGFASPARLEIEQAGFQSTLRVYQGGATSVEVMGDFTDWQPVALSRTGSGSWELRISIRPGTHRLNIRVDGGSWQVPSGTRLELDEFGSAVGVVVIP